MPCNMGSSEPRVGYAGATLGLSSLPLNPNVKLLPSSATLETLSFFAGAHAHRVMALRALSLVKMRGIEASPKDGNSGLRGSGPSSALFSELPAACFVCMGCVNSCSLYTRPCPPRSGRSARAFSLLE